jgi:hypothetical protein
MALTAAAERAPGPGEAAVNFRRGEFAVPREARDRRRGRWVATVAAGLLVLLAGAVALALGLPGLSLAAEAVAEAASDDKQKEAAAEEGIETLTVTAQRREQSIQDVPISMSGYSEAMTRDLGVENIDDLGRFTPGVETNNTQVTQPRFAIRGIAIRLALAVRLRDRCGFISVPASLPRSPPRHPRARPGRSVDSEVDRSPQACRRDRGAFRGSSLVGHRSGRTAEPSPPRARLAPPAILLAA